MYVFRWCLLLSLFVWVAACSPDEEVDASNSSNNERNDVEHESDVGHQDTADSEAPVGECEEGQTICSEDRLYLYACNADLEYERVKACRCRLYPEPHCDEPEVDPCDGNTGWVCAGERIRDCSTDQVYSCSDAGRCLMSDEGAACATKEGESQCLIYADTGDRVQLLCSDGDAIATDQFCNLRSGQCEPTEFSCDELALMGANQNLACSAGGDVQTRCKHGQPSGLSCEGDSACKQKLEEVTCYAPAQDSASCGGTVSCEPGQACVQSSRTKSVCAVDSSLDCADYPGYARGCIGNALVACASGTLWKWENLGTWTDNNGHCDQEMIADIRVPLGANCIAGVVNCEEGLACEMIGEDRAGVCVVADPAAPSECVLTNVMKAGNSCRFDWNACRNGKEYAVTCEPQNVAGTVISTCSCWVDGKKSGGFAGSYQATCGADTAEISRLVKEQCELPLRTMRRIN